MVNGHANVVIPTMVNGHANFTKQPEHFNKTFAPPFWHRNHQLEGAWSAHKQTFISREELPHLLKQRCYEML